MTVETREALGRAIKRERDARDWSQERLAKEAKIKSGHSYISELEQGDRNPSMEMLERIACAFGLTLIQLLQRADEERDGEGGGC